MKRRNSLRRMARDLHALAPSVPDPPPVAEGPQLAREAVAAFADALGRFQRAAAKGETLDNPTRHPDEHDLRWLREKSPEEITFDDIHRLSKIDPELAMSRWQEVKAAAVNDLDSGYLANRSLEEQGGSAWERARFIAVRQRLREAWPPRNAGEAMLIDAMAQYETMRLQWVSILSMMARQPQTILRLLRQHGKSGEERTQHAAQSTLEAARMVERLQRMYQSTLRTLLGLRRAPAPAIFQRSAQVNIAMGPQLNVSAATAGPDARNGGTVVFDDECDPRAS